jgi:hypothetical protein
LSTALSTTEIMTESAGQAARRAAVSTEILSRFFPKVKKYPLRLVVPADPVNTLTTPPISMLLHRN